MKQLIKYSVTKKVLLAILILFFVILAVTLLSIFFITNTGLGSTVETILIAVPIILIFVAFIYVSKVMLNISATISHNEQGITIELDKTNFFYKVKTIEIPFSNILNIANDADNYGRKFISIKTKTPNTTHNISANKNNDDESNVAFEVYWEELEHAVNYYNHHNDFSLKNQIQKKSIYQQIWARWLAVISSILAVVLIIAKIYNSEFIPTFRLVIFLAYTVPFCLLVYNANKK